MSPVPKLNAKKPRKHKGATSVRPYVTRLAVSAPIYGAHSLFTYEISIPHFRRDCKPFLNFFPHSYIIRRNPVSVNHKRNFFAHCLSGLTFFDMLRHSFNGGGGELVQNVVKPMFLQYKTLPVGEAALVAAHPVIAKPIPEPCVKIVVVHVLEEEQEKQITDFLSRSLNGIAVFFLTRCDD